MAMDKEWTYCIHEYSPTPSKLKAWIYIIHMHAERMDIYWIEIYSVHADGG